MSRDWQERYPARTVSASQALVGVRRGSRVLVGSGCAEPTLLVSALAERNDVVDVEVLHIMTIGQAPYAAAAQSRRFRHNAFFIGSNVRGAMAVGAADCTPVFLSEVPAFFRSRRFPLDIAPVSTTPPDAHGFVSLGVSVDVVKAAVETAEIAVARYALDRASRLAEVAFTIHDDLQGKGIGTYLLYRLMAIARERGIQGFFGYVLTNNVRMLNLFHKCGVPVHSNLEGGVYTITIHFGEIE